MACGIWGDHNDESGYLRTHLLLGPNQSVLYTITRSITHAHMLELYTSNWCRPRRVLFWHTSNRIARNISAAIH